MAEALARHLAPDVMEASSAGLMALGYVAPPTRAVLEESGVSSEGLVSKPLRTVDLGSIDLAVNLAGRSIEKHLEGRALPVEDWEVGDPFGSDLEVYRRIRDELLAAEVALKDERERVAELRRRLPEGTPVETDYVFREGPADLARNAEADFVDTRLSELFGDKSRLVVQHMMFGPAWEKGCPMCSMWADGFDGAAPHVGDKVAFAVVARAPIGRLREWGRQRGWRHLRLLAAVFLVYGAGALVGTVLHAGSSTLLAWLPFVCVAAVVVTGFVRHREPPPG